LDKDKNSRIAAQRPSEKTAGLRKCVSVCERNKKQELNTLDETDFVRDVENRDYHYLSHFEIDGAKRIYQQLEGGNW
jgi:hypothetical protein